MKLPLCTSVHCILESELGRAVKPRTRGWLNVMETRHEYFSVGSPELSGSKRLVSLDWTAPMFLVLQKPNQPFLRLVPIGAEYQMEFLKSCIRTFQSSYHFFKEVREEN